jgi:hypothetical protein
MRVAVLVANEQIELLVGAVNTALFLLEEI